MLSCEAQAIHLARSEAPTNLPHLPRYGRQPAIVHLTETIKPHQEHSLSVPNLYRQLMSHIHLQKVMQIGK